jgi:hypothetical protein
MGSYICGTILYWESGRKRSVIHRKRYDRRWSENEVHHKHAEKRILGCVPSWKGENEVERHGEKKKDGNAENELADLTIDQGKARTYGLRKRKQDNEPERPRKKPEGLEGKYYRVDYIVSHQEKNGRVLYLVKWHGYDHNENTWEGESSFADVQVIKDYWAERAKARKSSLREQR